MRNLVITISALVLLGACQTTTPVRSSTSTINSIAGTFEGTLDTTSCIAPPRGQVSFEGKFDNGVISGTAPRGQEFSWKIEDDGSFGGELFYFTSGKGDFVQSYRGTVEDRYFTVRGEIGIPGRSGSFCSVGAKIEIARIATPASPVAIQAPGSIRIPIIDAHSQLAGDRFPEGALRAKQVVPFLDEVGVSRVLLEPLAGTRTRDVAALSIQFPDRITGLAGSKSSGLFAALAGGKFSARTPGTGASLDIIKNETQVRGIGGMGEILLWHDVKGPLSRPVAPEIILSPFQKDVQRLISITKNKGWPLILHIESRAFTDAGKTFLQDLEKFFATEGKYPITLMMGGAIPAKVAKRFLETYPNVYLMTAHATPVEKKKRAEAISRLSRNFAPWFGGTMFDGDKLSSAWRSLMLAHPDRFIMAFDMVRANHWKFLYKNLVSFWRTTLNTLPQKVAHKIAHENAERLWNLPPAK